VRAAPRLRETGSVDQTIGLSEIAHIDEPLRVGGVLHEVIKTAKKSKGVRREK
jgi:hypothetical protein